jgi:hypothetical protein
LYAVLIDIVIPLILYGAIMLINLIDSLAIIPILGVIINIVTSILNVVAIIVAVIFLTIFLVLLFRELGIFSFITIVPVAISIGFAGLAVSITAIATVFVLLFFIFNNSWFAVAGILLTFLNIFLVFVGTPIVLLLYFVPWSLTSVAIHYICNHIKWKPLQSL